MKIKIFETITWLYTGKYVCAHVPCFVFGMNLFWLPLYQVTGSLVPKSETYLMTLLELIPTIPLQNRVGIRRHFPINWGSRSCSSETQAPGMTADFCGNLSCEDASVWYTSWCFKSLAKKSIDGLKTNSRKLEMMWGYLRSYLRFFAWFLYHQKGTVVCFTFQMMGWITEF